MAVTALWRVKGYIGKVLLYAENPEKTSNPEIIQVPKELNRDILEDVIAYAGRDKATNQRQLVWGINCTAENARHEMMAVKRQFRKEKGTVAYHGYQSFKEGEVTPELAHLIGIRLATELWGDRYHKPPSPSAKKRTSAAAHCPQSKSNASSTTVIVAPMTSKLDKPSLPTHVFAKTDCGLRRNSIILMEQLSTIDQFRLTQRIGALDETTMKEVNNALAVSVGIA